MVCLLSFAGPRFDAKLEPDHRYANNIIETFFNWAISGLFILVFSIQLTEYIKFTDVWIRLVDQWSQKRPLYQLSHNHCPTFKNFVCCFLFEWKEVKVSNVMTQWLEIGNLKSTYQCICFVEFSLPGSSLQYKHVKNVSALP